VSTVIWTSGRADVRAPARRTRFLRVGGHRFSGSVATRSPGWVV